MARTDIDIDGEACAEVMRRYGVTTKRGAVDLAPRILAAARPLGVILGDAMRVRPAAPDGR